MSRLSPGTLVVAIIAVLFALTGAFSVRQFLEQERSVDTVELEVLPVSIPVAVTDLEPGRKIRESDFATLKMTPEKFATSKYANDTFISQVEQLIGRVIRHELKSGMTVGPDGLYSEGTGPTVADQLSAGMRAVTVKVTGSGFLEGFAAPGTVVDVLFRSSDAVDDEIPETTITALHRIKVLAVDESPYPQSLPEPSPGGPSSPREDVRVTFSVLPAQATMLKALEDRGEISLVLRSNEEPEHVVGARIKDLEQERHAQTLSTILEGAKTPLVAVATTELVEGRVVRAGDIRLVEAQPDDPDGDTTYSAVESLVGRVLRTDVTSGQPLTTALLYPEGVGPGVADRLSPGFRAVTVKMDQAAVVDGFVSPGTHVDIFFRAEEVEEYPETTLRVLDGLKVLAIEDRTSPGAAPQDDESSQSIRVTFEVPLGEVGRLQALEGHGVITLAVRANKERSIGEIVQDLGSTQQELEDVQRKIAALKQISQLDESINLSKEQSDRLDLLLAEVPELERRLKSLDDEKLAATSGSSQTTLAEVLNLPEPPRPVKLEIYNGGHRETLVFNQGRRTTSASQTASRVLKDPSKANIKQEPQPVQGTVKQASDSKEVDVQDVSLTAPDRKVSEISNLHSSGVESLVVDRRVSGQGVPSRRIGFVYSVSPKNPQVASGSKAKNTLIESVVNFGRVLVNGLSKAAQPADRVEIVRGGVKE